MNFVYLKVSYLSEIKKRLLDYARNANTLINIIQNVLSG